MSFDLNCRQLGDEPTPEEHAEDLRVRAALDRAAEREDARRQAAVDADVARAKAGHLQREHDLKVNAEIVVIQRERAAAQLVADRGEAERRISAREAAGE